MSLFILKKVSIVKTLSVLAIKKAQGYTKSLIKNKDKQSRFTYFRKTKIQNAPEVNIEYYHFHLNIKLFSNLFTQHCIFN